MQTKIEKRSQCCGVETRLVGGTIKNTVCTKCNYACKTIRERVRVPEADKTIITDEIGEIKFNPESDPDWKCQLFGMQDGLVLTPPKGKIPNAFWRLMQYLIIGNKWVRNKK